MFPHILRLIVATCIVGAGLAAPSRSQAQSLPAGWAAQDIGSPGSAGSATVSSGTWTVKGGGADVYGTGDQFHFAAQDFSADGSIVARVTAVQNTGTYAKAGVMLRATNAANAGYAFVFVTPTSAGFECRNGAGASSFGAGSSAGTAPRWVKIGRTGNSVAGFVSTDGVNWTQLGSAQTLLLPGAAKAGLAVCANNNAALNTSTFTNVAVAAAASSRVNWAKFQNAWSDSATSGHDTAFATDGIVGNANGWQSNSGAGGHWIGVTLPAARQIGSIQLYLGSDDTNPVANFGLHYNDGSGMQPIPGASFSGNTATVLNIPLAATITASQVMLYTTDASATVREIVLLPPNATGGWPIGTDVSLNLAKKRAITASTADSTNYAKLAVDGYAGANAAWRSSNVNGAHSLNVDLGATSRIGSAHVYSGSTTAAAIANFRLQYWTGTTWFDVPGGVISGNTQKDRVVNFTTPVSTSRVLLLLSDNGTQTVRELAIFPASTGITTFPLGTSVALADGPATKADDLGDNWWKIINRSTGGTLTAGISGAGEARAFTPDFARQFQLLYNIGSDTYRIRQRATGQCLEAQNAGSAAGTAVVLGDYSAQPHQLWRIVDAGGGFAFCVNAWNGLMLQTDAQSPATVTLATPSTDLRQQWQLSFQSVYLKKGLADYRWDWAKTGVGWNYNWGQTASNTLPAATTFTPMQWGTAGIDQLPRLIPGWQREAKPTDLLGFNEPDFPNSVGGSDVPLGTAVNLWPQLEAADLPLVSPAPAITFSQWENDFFGAANALGYRVDFTGVHWYGNPDAGALIGLLANIYNTYGRPVWLTEFATVDWSNSQSWSEEDNYRFMAEFMWMAEDQWWLKRYSVFPFYEDPPANPWDRTHPKTALFNNAGAYTSVGDLYSGWDGDRTVRNNMPYLLHGKGAALHLGNDGAIHLGTIRENGADMQWALVPTTWNAYVAHLVSLRDGRMLGSDGAGLYLAGSSTTGAAVEWTYTHLANGYFVLNHQLSGKRLRMNRSNDGNGAPTGIWLSMDSGTAGDDFVQFRFIKPAQAADVADLPAGWSAQDIGTPQQAGSSFYDSGSGVWMVSGGGADIFGTNDQFQFVARDFTGDAAFIARVGSVQASDPFAKAGVMFRDGTGVDAAFAHLFAGPSTIGFEYRSATGVGAQSAAYIGGTAPLWLKLVRTGNSFRAYFSADGATWTQLGAAQTLTFSASAKAGLAVTAHNAAALNSSTFTDVSLSPLDAFSAWQYQNFTAAQLADSNISGPLADANRDGVANLLAYSAGLTPWTAATTANGGRPFATAASGRLAITFTRSTANTDLTLAVQGADSLAGPWTDLARSNGGAAFAPLVAGVAITEGSGTIRSAEVRDAYAITDPAHPRRFLRLRVSSP